MTADGARPSAARPALLLDVSRLVSRIGAGTATGIDRVEAEWLRQLQSRPHLLLARLPKRQALLPASVGPELLSWLEDPARVPIANTLIGRLRRDRTPRARAEEVLAGLALGIGTGTGRGLSRAIARHVSSDGVWLSLGHTNLAPGPWPTLEGLRRVVMIHDTIPLDFPQFTRRGQDAAFRARFEAALSRADLVVTVSAATRADVVRWRDRLALPGRARIEAVPIGTTVTPADPGAIPPDLPLDRPVFVALGTIEPRKNHALLLDAWTLLAQRLAPEAVPRLLILGRRGWENEATFARLDALPPDGPVIERAGVSDGAVAALLERAHGLVMPSRAEGFGLPLTEAAARGVPILATPLPAAREVLRGVSVVWLPTDDPAPWADAVAASAAAPVRRTPALATGSWSAHVSGVLGLAGMA